jgi:hypothetical protein
MTTKRAVVLAVAAAAATAGTVLTACSSGPGADGSQRTVFPTTDPAFVGVTMQTTVPTGETVNFGIANLSNTSNALVTIRAVKLISPSGPAIRDVTYQAYTGRGLGAPLGIQGDLPRTCPELYKPRPMSSFSIAARSSGLGEVVVSFTIVKPGHYIMGKMRIDYVSDGHRFWQLYYLPVKITAVPAASNPRLVHPYKCSHKAHL